MVNISKTIREARDGKVRARAGVVNKGDNRRSETEMVRSEQGQVW